MKTEITYLIGFLYHQPRTMNLFNAGMLNEYESSSGFYVSASSKENAFEWGEKVAEKIFQDLNNDPTLTLKKSGYHAWVIDVPEQSSWRNKLETFPKIDIGEFPHLDFFDETKASV
ncbi:MAG: hypothetical protein OCD01_10445 [Fibrobacterales bacterium]